MGVDGPRLADLDVAGLGFGDFEGGFELVGLDDFGKGDADGDVFADLMGEVDEDAFDASANAEGVLLFLLEAEEGLRLLDFCLLDGDLGDDGLLVEGEALAFDVVADAELVGFAAGFVVFEAADDAEVEEAFIGLGLQLGLFLVGTHGGRAGALGHEVALEFGAGVLEVGLCGLELELRVEHLLLGGGVDEVHDDGVGVDEGTGEDADVNDGGLGLGGNEANFVFAGDEGAGAADLAQEWAALDDVGEEGTFDGGDGGFEAEEKGDGDADEEEGEDAEDEGAALFFLLQVGAGDIHAWGCSARGGPKGGE